MVNCFMNCVLAIEKNCKSVCIGETCFSRPIGTFYAMVSELNEKIRKVWERNKKMLKGVILSTLLRGTGELIQSQCEFK